MVFTDVWADTEPGRRGARVDQRQVHRQRQPGRRPGDARRRPTASSTTRSTSRRSGRVRAAPAAPTPAPTATADPAKLDLRADHLRHRPRHLVRGAAARRPGDRPGHRPAADSRSSEGVPMIVRGPAAGRNDGRRRGGHDALEPAGRDPVRRDAEGRRRGAHRAPEPAVDRARPLDDAQRGRAAPRHRMDGSGWPVLQQPVRRRRARGRNPLSQATFNSQVYPILQAATVRPSCHQAGGVGAPVAPGTSFQGNRFVLTGSPEGDYNVTLSMISDTCNRGVELPAVASVCTVGHPAAPAP